VRFTSPFFFRRHPPPEGDGNTGLFLPNNRSLLVFAIALIRIRFLFDLYFFIN